MNGRTPQQLHSLLDKHFDLSELRKLAFDLAINHENLAGNNKRDFILSLITYAERHGLTNSLNERVDQRLKTQGELDTALPQNRAGDGRTAVWLALALVVIAVVAILTVQLWPDPPELTATPPSVDKILLQVQVNSTEDQSAITNAKVSLEVADQLFAPERTDSNGRAVFTLSANLAGEIGTIKVEANSQIEDQNVTIDFGMRAVEFQIRP